MINKDIFFIGYGGHYQVLKDALGDENKKVKGIISTQLKSQSYSEEASLLFYSDRDFQLNIDPENVLLINAIGFVPNQLTRKELFIKYKKLGYKFLNITAGTSFISSLSSLCEGVQVLFQSSVMANVQIGENTIVNNAAHIDHDCNIGAHNHIAPGATLCGTIHTGDNVFIGAGSTILPDIRIGSNSLIQAGAVVSFDIPENSTIYRDGKLKNNQ